MYQPEIIFAPEKGKIYDFVALLSHSTKTSELSQLYNEFNITLDYEIKSSYSRIHSAINEKNNDLLKLLFSSSENGISFFSTFKNQLMESNNVEDLINKIINYDINLFPMKILSFLDTNNNFDDKFYQIILADKDMLFTYLDNINLSDKDKWTFIKFIEDPKSMLDDLYLVFNSIKTEIDIEYKILKEYREKYYSTLKAKIDKSLFDINKLSKVLPINRPEYNGVAFERINVYVMTYLPYTFQGIWNNRILNLYLGFYYDKQINKKYNDIEDIAFIFKAFSDETRNRIIKTVNEMPNIGFGDIGKELDMPLSSLSHHMDIIVEAGIINRLNEGKKTFFTINNEGLENAIRILTSIKI